MAVKRFWLVRSNAAVLIALGGTAVQAEPVAFKSGHVSVQIVDGMPAGSDFGDTVSIDPTDLPKPKNWSGEIGACRRDVPPRQVAMKTLAMMKREVVKAGYVNIKDDFFLIYSAPKLYSQSFYNLYQFKFKRILSADRISYSAKSTLFRARSVKGADGSLRMTLAGATVLQDGVTGKLGQIVEDILQECA